MTPPPSGDHSNRQGEIAFLLRQLLGGRALPECPISTLDGVKAADVGWYSEERYRLVAGQLAFEIAPEICVEILSPRNSPIEIRAKRQLYFESGAREVWICDLTGRMSYFATEGPDDPRLMSALCPTFPTIIS